MSDARFSERDGAAAVSGLLAAAQKIATWFRHRDDLSALSDAEVELLAHDLGVSPSALRQVTAEGPGGADLFYRRLAALGLTAGDIDRMASGLRRDMECDCARCDSKERCAHDLDLRPESPGWMTYCLNAETLDAARRSKGRGPI